MTWAVHEQNEVVGTKLCPYIVYGSLFEYVWDTCSLSTKSSEGLFGLPGGFIAPLSAFTKIATRGHSE